MLTIDYLQDPPLSGAENMGRDEALLRMATDESRPVLRTYGWSSPTISLGYFQGVDETIRLGEALRELPLVRRSTGGGAILHDLELTYSLVLPINHPLIAGKPNRLYSTVHRAVAKAVGDTLPDATQIGMHRDHVAEDGYQGEGHRAQHGPFFCFARRSGYDVVIDRDRGALDKLAGSAQRRTRAAILQHGSIILASRFDEQPCATWSRYALQDIDFAEAARRFVEALARTLDVALGRREWTTKELSAAARYRAMHASEAWIRDRVRPTDNES